MIEKIKDLEIIKDYAFITSCGAVAAHLNVKISEILVLIMLLCDCCMIKVKHN